jgi:hypothetical protein
MGQLSLKQESRCAFQNDGDRHSGIHIQEGYVEEGRQQSLPLTQSVWHHSGGKPKPEFSCDLEETRAPRRSQAGGSPSASRSPNPIRNQRAMADGYGFLKLDHRLHPGEGHGLASRPATRRPQFRRFFAVLACCGGVHLSENNIFTAFALTGRTKLRKTTALRG